MQAAGQSRIPGTAPPAGVNGAHRPADGIIQQDDAAVGGKDRQGQVRFIGDKGVGGVIPGGPQALPSVGGGAEADGGLMDLLGEDRTRRIHPQSAAEAAVILPDMGQVIPPAHAQVQGVPGRSGDAALPGGKPVADAGEQGRGQIDEAVLFMESKGHSWFLSE